MLNKRAQRAFALSLFSPAVPPPFPFLDEGRSEGGSESRSESGAQGGAPWSLRKALFGKKR